MLFKYLLIFVILVFVFSEIYVYIKAQGDSIKEPDIILLLGNGTKIDHPPLKERILRTLFAHTQFPKVPVVVSGTPTESAAMLTALEIHIPKSSLSIHSDAKRTQDSFLYVQKTFPDKKNLWIATNNFHKKRSLALSKAYGFKATVIQKPQIYNTSLIHHIYERLGRLRFTLESIFSFNA